MIVPRRRDEDLPGLGASRTLRQQLGEALRGDEITFHGLQDRFGLTVRALEDELRHVERSARAAGERLVVTPAHCLACGFVFRDREARHLHAPGRCPRCRAERIADPRFRIRSRS